MSSMREIELKYFIENIQLEIDYIDLSEKEEKEKIEELKKAKVELKQLQK